MIICDLQQKALPNKEKDVILIRDNKIKIEFKSDCDLLNHFILEKNANNNNDTVEENIYDNNNNLDI